jgi:hypothetical protein
LEIPIISTSGFVIRKSPQVPPSRRTALSRR